MRFIALIFVLLISCSAASAQLPMTGAGLGVPGGGTGPFVGIADVYTNTIAHWSSSRAASSAQKGQKLLNVCDAATGLVCSDWSSSVSTGLIVPTTIGGSSCGSIACEVAIVYDDSGANSCVGAPCNMTQAHGTRPGLTLSGLNSLPTITCNGSTFVTLAAAGLSVVQPFTFSAVAERTANPSSGSTIFGSTTDVILQFLNSSGNLSIFAGTNLNTTSGAFTESTFHAIQAVANSTTSSIQGDGAAPVTGNANTHNMLLASTIYLCNDGFSEFLTGAISEVWAGTGDQSATFNSAHSNQSAVYGTP